MPTGVPLSEWRGPGHLLGAGLLVPLVAVVLGGVLSCGGTRMCQAEPIPAVELPASVVSMRDGRSGEGPGCGGGRCVLSRARPGLPCPARVPREGASPACASAAVEAETASQASEPASQASDEEDAPATDIYFVSPPGLPPVAGPSTTRAHLCLCVCRRARTNPRTLMSTPFTHGRATPSHTPTDALHAHGTRAHLQVPPSGAGTSVCSPSHTSSLSGDAAAPCPRHPPQPRAHVWPCAQRGLGRCLESRCAQPPGPRGGPG